MLIFKPLETSDNHKLSVFSGSMKGNIDPKRVEQLQYQRKRHNLMLLACNVSSSIPKKNYLNNKTT